ncbi:unnamed protein product [Allacma fusca]|uniref:Uncharacterized protein n=1 Tax=Allacma fusca TaxID=39272 RepID=A0A8J2JN97_9HEXA|nr:unnamed protein product [Allacma fusca]
MPWSSVYKEVLAVSTAVTCVKAENGHLCSTGTKGRLERWRLIATKDVDVGDLFDWAGVMSAEGARIIQPMNFDRKTR